MIFQYQKRAKTIEVLNDLVRIHNDRIAAYTYALNQCADLEPGLCNTFGDIIADSRFYKEQLEQQIKQLHGDPQKGSTILGKIYRAWTVLKVTFPGSTQKAIIASCLYNEEIALHAYKAALSANIELGTDIKNLIERQEDALRKIYMRVNKYRESRFIADHRLTYFV